MSATPEIDELKKILIYCCEQHYGAVLGDPMDVPNIINQAKAALTKYIEAEVLRELKSAHVEVEYTDSDALVNMKALRTHKNVHSRIADLEHKLSTNKEKL